MASSLYLHLHGKCGKEDASTNHIRQFQRSDPECVKPLPYWYRCATVKISYFFNQPLSVAHRRQFKFELPHPATISIPVSHNPQLYSTGSGLFKLKKYDFIQTDSRAPTSGTYMIADVGAPESDRFRLWRTGTRVFCSGAPTDLMRHNLSCVPAGICFM